jgi:branched-chain amino acid transport system permease protein
MTKTLRDNLGPVLRVGLLGSGIALYLAAVGMVETFLGRNLVGTFVSVGDVFLFAGSLAAGLLAAREMNRRAVPVLAAAAAGALAGFISALLPVLLTLLIQVAVMQGAGEESVFYLRDMFVHFSEVLFNKITFGDGVLLGNLRFALTCALVGLVGASFVLLPRKWRLAWINAWIWVLGVGLFSEMVGQIVQTIFGPGMKGLMFQAKALTPPAAAMLFVIAFAVGYFQINQSTRARWRQMPENRQRQGRVVLILLGMLLVLSLPWLVGLFLSQALFIVGLYVLMGLGLNIVVGFAGLLDLGYVAFFAFGAYTMAILTTTSSIGRGGLSFWTALPFAVLAGVLWGFILGFPVLRMRGDYLAIVTLGFGEIIRILALSNWLAPIEGGAQGVLHIPPPQAFGLVFNNPQWMYYLTVLGSVFAAFVAIRLRSSRLGRQWMAMREDEDVAEAMGINLVQTKLSAFAIGASFAAVAGAIFAARLGNIFPTTFNLLISINALALIIVGGMGSIPGVVVGALILVGMPEVLREFEDYRLLLYGILLVVMMLAKPEGFLPEARRRVELHAQEESLAGGAADD